jgi:glycerol-3-phosphate dehydrogenase
MFTFPWEGTSIIGTTDLDHEIRYESDTGEPHASEDEIAYMLEALNFTFPSIEISHSDVISTFAGLRPIISTGKANPSDESRAHRVWEEDGLVTIGGGKYTTFRIMACDVLNFIRKEIPRVSRFKTQKGVFQPPPDIVDPPVSLTLAQLTYLQGRYGKDTPNLLEYAEESELVSIEALPNIWAELRWSAHAEGVVHLDDLLLRRVRIGVTLPNGGMAHMDRIRTIVQVELGWDDQRWKEELQNYKQRWATCYSP